MLIAYWIYSILFSSFTSMLLPSGFKSTSSTYRYSPMTGERIIGWTTEPLPAVPCWCWKSDTMALDHYPRCTSCCCNIPCPSAGFRKPRDNYYQLFNYSPLIPCLSAWSSCQEAFYKMVEWNMLKTHVSNLQKHSGISNHQLVFDDKRPCHRPDQWT